MAILSADPAGVLASNQHRRVLGHLSHPDDDYGWTIPALALRVSADAGLKDSDLSALLAELASDGLAESSAAGAWRMTDAGFATLTGPAANQGDEGPAAIEAHPSNVGSATEWGA